MTRNVDEVLRDSEPPSETIAVSPDTAPASPPEVVRTEVQIDDSAAILCYANFCRATGTPEELILDFGLNAQPMGIPSSIEIKQRLVLNYFTAKRLLHALSLSVQRHEIAFGVLETDVQKRVTQVIGRAAAQG
jgi:hypothetical protein